MALPKASRPATELVNEPRRSAWRQSQEAKAKQSLNQASRPQASRFRVRCWDSPAPINAASTRRQLPARQYIAAEPRRITLAAIEEMLEVLPYGRYVASDGREIIFNRHYRPIWERLPDGTVRRANPHEWVDWIRQGWFGLGSMRYEKSAREAYRKVLRDFLDGKPLTVENERRRVRR
jgi:hypothetical protein